MFERECEICGPGARHRMLYTKAGYSIYACEGCGLAWTQLPPGFDPRQIYSHEYFQGDVADGYANYRESEPVLRRNFRKVLDEISSRGVSRGRLLEIGCAYGYLLEEARVRYDCFGIEASEDAIRVCRNRGLRVYDEEEGWRLCLGSPAEPFDVIVMLDCIEHLKSPLATLATGRKAIRDGGFLLLTTGDFDSPLARLLGRHWRLMTPPQHLYFFSERTIRALLRKTGFEVVSLRHPWKEVPVGLALYQLTRRLSLRIPLSGAWDQIAIPVNLFDAMQVVAKAVR